MVFQIQNTSNYHPMGEVESPGATKDVQIPFDGQLSVTWRH